MAGQQTIPNLPNEDDEHTQVAQLPPVEELVQVVYRSDPQGALVGVESTSLLSSYPAEHSSLALGAECQLEQPAIASGQHQQLSRAASTLPSVAEESTSSGPTGGANGTNGATNGAAFLQDDDGEEEGVYRGNEFNAGQAHTSDEFVAPAGELLPIYSTIQRHQQPSGAELLSSYTTTEEQSSFANKENELIDYAPAGSESEERPVDECERVNEEIGAILGKQRAAGAAEKGSFRNNFRKKLGLSASTNENDLTAHRQKFIESVQDDEKATTSSGVEELQLQQQQHAHQQHQLQAASRAEKFKRTHSVSFNVHGARANRHSVDIRNLPSYLTHKRASIVDVAKGAMSSLISSFGGGGGGSSSNSIVSGRRDSTQEPNVSEPDDDELDDQAPIFEEPIAPTLSLGQRVAMVGNSGTEFGTVGWIGQLADVDDDWVVGVIFDNMIGDCDGAYKGARYFYARDNYAMFVPLQALTKTDNYIGRPETGTVLSRMSVSLKPGQLISIQRSSIRLQHCFLNAPHQRVGHDVRAVSNRLHCQCHNCGPCAHLTKQGRPNVLPHFGAHHLPHRKRNSLAHAAVQMLAHHHHHFHEEEEHEEKDYEFGDNAAHACNFVRYSCCQQSGQPGHEFSTDCGMVRPELLDNLIHAPKAPHRRSRPRRPRAIAAGQQAGGQPRHRSAAKLARADQKLPIEGAHNATQQQQQTNTLETNQSTLGFTNDTVSTIKTTTTTNTTNTRDDDAAHGFYSLSSGSSSRSSHSSRSSSPTPSSHSGSSSPSRSSFAGNSQLQAAPLQEPYNYYQYDTSSFRPQNNVFQTVESQVSIVDQQRYVYRRDSSAYVHSARGQASDWSDTSSAQMSSTGNLGKRILRCLGCLKQQRRKRKLSFRDRVLEYRRRQSTFVPSTLAKPHEDFASHGIILNSGGGGGLADSRAAASQQQQQAANSDYSSCSKSGSSCSSRSHSPDRDAMGAGQYQQQTTIMTMEHGQFPNDQELKSAAMTMQWTNHRSSYYQNNDHDDNYKPQLNYGDYNFYDGYNNEFNKKGTEDLSKDSALISEFPYSDTYKTNSSSDTLKFLIDQSINEQVLPMTPMQEQDCLVSPISSSQAAENRGESATSDQVDISSPTASAIDGGDYDQGQQQLELQEGLENLFLNSPDDCNQSPPDEFEN